MSKSSWALLQCLGLLVLVGAGQAIVHGLISPGSPLLWGAFDWVPGGWDGQLIVLGSITIIGLLITVGANLASTKTYR